MVWIGIVQGLVTALIGAMLVRRTKGGRRAFGIVMIALGTAIVAASVAWLGAPKR